MTDQLLHSIPTCPGNNTPVFLALGNEEIYLIGFWQKRVYALGPGVEAIERDPYPGVEYPSRRAYVFARKP
jgi:hypothetical protein